MFRRNGHRQGPTVAHPVTSPSEQRPRTRRLEGQEGSRWAREHPQVLEALGCS